MDSPRPEVLATDLILYHTLGCHLCELAEALVAPLAQAAGMRLERIDIADSEWLLERYGTRIPVLRVSGAQNEEIGWPFDAEAVWAMFAALSRSSDGAHNPVSR